MFATFAATSPITAARIAMGKVILVLYFDMSEDHELS